MELEYDSFNLFILRSDNDFDRLKQLGESAGIIFKNINSEAGFC